MAIFVHLASVWVPFTSEAKEAVAHYPELLREITLALQECGRKLAQSLRARARAEGEAKRKSLFERYIPELGQSLSKITGQDRRAIEKGFFKALPSFVKGAEAAQNGENGTSTPAPAPGDASKADSLFPASPSEPPPPPPDFAPKKPLREKTKKGEQLKLLD
jgi:DNA topoisomerase VI subunit B